MSFYFIMHPATKKFCDNALNAPNMNVYPGGKQPVIDERQIVEWECTKNGLTTWYTKRDEEGIVRVRCRCERHEC